MSKKLLALVIALWMILSLTSAGLGVVLAQNSAGVNTGSLRIANAAPGIGPLDVFLDNERVSFSLQPGDATTYFVIPAGRHALAVRPVNADPLSAPVADLLIDLPPNGSQTAVIYQRQFSQLDSAFPTPIEQSCSIFVINDDRSPIELGTSRITAAHLAVGTSSAISIGYPSGEALLYRIGPEQPFGTIDVPAGSYSLAVIDNDGLPNPTLPLLDRLGERQLYSSTLYTMLVVPNATPSAVAGQVGQLPTDVTTYVLSAPLEPPPDGGLRLRLIHAAYDAAVVDIYIDERLVASRMGFREFTEYLGLSAYSHEVSIRRYPSRPNGPVIGRAKFTVTPENRSQITWTLLLRNASADEALPTATPALNAAQPTPQPNSPVLVTITNDLTITDSQVVLTLLPDNLARTERDFSRVRLLNAANGIQGVSLYTDTRVNPPVLATAVPSSLVSPTATPPPAPGFLLTQPALFGAEAAESDELRSGLYRAFRFAIPFTDPPFVLNTEVTNQQLVPGIVYTFVLMGNAAVNTGETALQAVVLQDYGTGLSIRREYNGIVRTTGSGVNVRTQPNQQSGLVITLENGDEVEVLGRNSTSEWVRVRFINSDGTLLNGWIFAQLVSVTRLDVPIRIQDLPVVAS
jgi:hypothetical protein